MADRHCMALLFPHSLTDLDSSEPRESCRLQECFHIVACHKPAKTISFPILNKAITIIPTNQVTPGLLSRDNIYNSQEQVLTFILFILCPLPYMDEFISVV